MTGKEWRGELRGAVHRGDGRAVVRLAHSGLAQTAPALQLIGGGLLRALVERVEGAAEQATACLTELAKRGWTGDDELGEQLTALLGTGPTPMLRPLPVDLEDLANALDGDPGEDGGLLDLQTGEVWPQSVIDYARDGGDEIEGVPDEDEDPDRWLPIDRAGSRAGYRDMEAFIDALDDPDQADRLQIAIQGRGAFRRFKDVLGRDPDELSRWFGFSEERQLGRARAWLAEAGYTPRAPST